MCGDREWSDRHIVADILEGLLTTAQLNFDTPLTIIDGCARGADCIGGDFFSGMRKGEACGRWDGSEGRYGSHVNVEHLHFPADWKKFDRAAGPIRNQQMLDEGEPQIVIAFHNNIAESKGTADMVKRAKKAGVRTYVISRP